MAREDLQYCDIIIPSPFSSFERIRKHTQVDDHDSAANGGFHSAGARVNLWMVSDMSVR